MWNKKGYDGMHFAAGLILALILGIILMIYLYNQGVLTPGMLPI